MESKKNLLDAVSQFSPRTLTILIFGSESLGVVDALAYDSPSSIIAAWFNLFDSCGLDC